MKPTDEAFTWSGFPVAIVLWGSAHSFPEWRQFFARVGLFGVFLLLFIAALVATRERRLAS